MNIRNFKKQRECPHDRYDKRLTNTVLESTRPSLSRLKSSQPYRLISLFGF